MKEIVILPPMPAYGYGNSWADRLQAVSPLSTDEVLAEMHKGSRERGAKAALRARKSGF